MEEKRWAAAAVQSAGDQVKACKRASQTSLFVAGDVPHSCLIFCLLKARLQVSGVARAIMLCWQVRMADPQPVPAGTT